MDSSKVYRPSKGKIYRRDKYKVKDNVHHSEYRDGSQYPHHANLHFVLNGNIVETIEEDVTFAWANARKKELMCEKPYCNGILVVVSIYAKDQINGGNRRSSKSRTIR